MSSQSLHCTYVVDHIAVVHCSYVTAVVTASTVVVLTSCTNTAGAMSFCDDTRLADRAIEVFVSDDDDDDNDDIMRRTRADVHLVEKNAQHVAAAVVAARVGERVSRLHAYRVERPREFARRFGDVAASTVDAWAWTSALAAALGVDHVALLACMYVARVPPAKRVRVSYACARDDVEFSYYATLTNERARMEAAAQHELLATLHAHVDDLVERVRSRDVLEPAIMATLDADVAVVDELLASVHEDAASHDYRACVASAVSALRAGDVERARAHVEEVHEWLADVLGVASGVDIAPTDAKEAAPSRRRRRRLVDETGAPRKRRRNRA